MNKLKCIIPSFLFLFIALSLQGQIRHTFHNTYELEEIETIELEVVGNVEFIKWKGTSLMAETVIELGNATKGILRHLLNKQRYELADNSDGTTLHIESVMKERKAVITQQGSCDEQVDVIIYVPKNFEVRGNNLIVRVEKNLEPVSGDE